MKISLSVGFVIYFGIQNNEIKLTKKSSDLVRDEHGDITGSTEIHFPTTYITSRIKNGNFVVKR